MSEKILFDFLDKHGIKYTLFNHTPVFTVSDKVLSLDPGKEGVELDIPGQHFKSLFLKDKKGEKFYLVTVIGQKRVDINALRKILGSSHLSFGSPEELMQFLKITPGSVSPYCLMFDTENKVDFYLDQDYANGPFVNFHPLRNDMTIGVEPREFIKCVNKMGHEPIVIEIPQKVRLDKFFCI